MPYELAFKKPVQISDRGQYINECCVGGDIVVNRLLPGIRARYRDIQTNQEDWGWFIWFRSGDVKLAVDVCSDDGDAGEFRIRLTSRRTRLLFESTIDTPELGELKAHVESELQSWGVSGLVAERDAH